MAQDAKDPTAVNEDLDGQFNGKKAPDEQPAQANDVQDANQAANAEFNDDGSEDRLGNTVGGLRGPSD